MDDWAVYLCGPEPMIEAVNENPEKDRGARQERAL